jgi:hypothetical protein
MQFTRKIYAIISLITLILSIGVNTLNLRNRYTNNNLNNALKKKGKIWYKEKINKYLIKNQKTYWK